MAADIVPIELGLANGKVATLWAPRWREGDDEWEAFLGLHDDLYAFDNIAELAAFIRTDDDHDLHDHPSWSIVAALSADALTPEPENCFDLAAVPRWTAAEPNPASVRDLDSCLTLIYAIGEVCGIDALTDFIDDHVEFDQLANGPSAFQGRSGAKTWAAIGKAVADGWPQVLDALDELVVTPEVDADALFIAEAELLAVDENEVEADDDLDTANALKIYDEDEDDEDDEDDGSGVSSGVGSAVAAGTGTMSVTRHRPPDRTSDTSTSPPSVGTCTPAFDPDRRSTRPSPVRVVAGTRAGSTSARAVAKVLVTNRSTPYLQSAGSAPRRAAAALSSR